MELDQWKEKVFPSLPSSDLFVCSCQKKVKQSLNNNYKHGNGTELTVVSAKFDTTRICINGNCALK